MNGEAGLAIELSGLATFALGACGAFAALLFVQGVPFFQALLDGDSTLELSAVRVVGAVGLTLSTLALGGFVALLLGDVTQAKQALAYGAAWQGTLGGLLNPQSEE